MCTAAHVGTNLAGSVSCARQLISVDFWRRPSVVHGSSCRCKSGSFRQCARQLMSVQIWRRPSVVHGCSCRYKSGSFRQCARQFMSAEIWRHPSVAYHSSCQLNLAASVSCWHGLFFLIGAGFVAALNPHDKNAIFFCSS